VGPPGQGKKERARGLNGADTWAGMSLACGAAGSVGGRWRERVRSGVDVLASGARCQREEKRARGRARRGASARGQAERAERREEGARVGRAGC